MKSILYLESARRERRGEEKRECEKRKLKTKKRETSVSLFFRFSQMQVCCRRGLLLRPSASASVPAFSAFSARQLATMRPALPAQKHGSAKRAKNNAGGRNSMSSSALPLPLPPPLPADTQVPAPPPADLDAHVAQAWEWWNGMGAPKYHVAPMVDQVIRNERENEMRVERCENRRRRWWRSQRLASLKKKLNPSKPPSLPSKTPVRARLPPALPQARRHLRLHPDDARSSLRRGPLLQGRAVFFDALGPTFDGAALRERPGDGARSSADPGAPWGRRRRGPQPGLPSAHRAQRTIRRFLDGGAKARVRGRGDSRRTFER